MSWNIWIHPNIYLTSSLNYSEPNKITIAISYIAMLPIVRICFYLIKAEKGHDGTDWTTL